MLNYPWFSSLASLFEYLSMFAVFVQVCGVYADVASDVADVLPSSSSTINSPMRVKLSMNLQAIEDFKKSLPIYPNAW